MDFAYKISINYSFLDVYFECPTRTNQTNNTSKQILYIWNLKSLIKIFHKSACLILITRNFYKPYLFDIDIETLKFIDNDPTRHAQSISTFIYDKYILPHFTYTYFHENIPSCFVFVKHKIFFMHQLNLNYKHITFSSHIFLCFIHRYTNNRYLFS